MKIKVIGLALMLSMTAVLGACDAGTETPPTGATTPAEPTDAGASTPAPDATAPAGTPTPTTTP